MRRERQTGSARAVVGFAGFGAFWGTWGAALPAVQRRADVSDAELGLALLCIGAGALASMRPTGVLVDRFGARVMPLSFVAFACGAAVTALATSPLALAAALLVVGAASGAADVAINTEGARAESAGRPLMNLAHAVFSASVVASSLLVGLLRTAGGGAALLLATVAALLLAVAALLLRLDAAPLPPPKTALPNGALLRVRRPLVILGALAALAYLIENAWQSWSAVQLESTLGAPPALASLGPALFAASAAAGRLAGHTVSQRISDRRLLAGGAGIAALGTVLGALAPTPSAALVGIAVAGLGTSVCAPTLISLAGRNAAPEARGSAVSAVTTLAYIGFLIGPAAVGLAAGLASLPAALAGVAGVAALLAIGARFAPGAEPPRSAAPGA